MTEVLLLLGSNIDPETNIPTALHTLGKMQASEMRAVSRTYRTPAIGADGKPSEQSDFHNVAVHLDTESDAQSLRDALRKIEAGQGRVRSGDKFAARPIDIDIVFFGKTSIIIGDTRIPDLDDLKQAHVVIPLAEIAPEWRHPQTNWTLEELAGQLVNQELELV